ncbi:MAG: transketolase [Ginsengibacter sp.]
MLSQEQNKSLRLTALNIKKRFLHMYNKANAGHIGSSLSCTEILTFIFFGWLEDEDELILSKGHAAAGLYSCLAEKNIITENEIDTFYKNGTYLSAHPPPAKINKIPFATGSLGHGLSLACGLALAKKLKGATGKIFCITSDGELNEGSTWEAAMAISHHQLNNVIWFIDNNNLQGFGRTSDVINMGSISEKLKSFGFEVHSADGHKFTELEQIKMEYKSQGLPTAIICNTFKGRGWKEYEDKIDSHYLPLKENGIEELIWHLENETFD